MEIIKKCSSDEHQEIEAVYYCQNCNIYMCNKCEKFHSNIFKKHLKILLGKDKTEIFTGLCQEKDHSNKLLFFCKTHNKLCCSSCLCKIKKKGFGQHKDCDVCEIEDIKEEKKNKYEENIKYLENLSNNIQESINNLKLIHDKIEENKEQFISNVQKIFTKIRNALNEREDELLLIIKDKYKNFDLGDNIIKENEKLPNQIKIILDNSKKNDNKWNNDEELNIEINECLEIEEKINKIKKINSALQPDYSQINIRFGPNENQINDFIQTIRNFGQILLTQCSICYSVNNLRKCLCKKIFCLNCLNEKKNIDCQKTCYLFNNNLNYNNQIYNISKYPLPNNFEIKLYFSAVDWIRSGITFDEKIKNCKSDDNSPKFDVYYVLEGLNQFYNLSDTWRHFNGIGRKLQSGDNMIITLIDGKMNYTINGTQLDFIAIIPLKE